MSTPGPLDGVTVLDLTRVLSGPYCTMVLGDLGARVVKVEHPRRGDDTRHWGPPFVAGESTYFLSINRNKESVAVDFKSPAGRAVVEALAARADVVVENFRPGTLAAVGLDRDTLTTRHPRLIYCSISGYGQTGPRRDEPGYDAVIQAEGGLMSITGDPDGSPYRLGIAITDIVTGLFAGQAILAALYARERTGRGQAIDLGMLDATAALLTYQAAIRFATGESPPRLGNRHPNIVPYETFAVADGSLVIAVGNDDIWRRFAAAVGLGPLADDPRFATNRARVTNYEALKPQLDEALATATRADWIRRLGDAGVPCGSVRSVGEVLDDPQLAARGMIERLLHPSVGALQLVGSPLHLSDTPATVRTPPPTLGQHTDAVLDELGYDQEERAALRASGVI
ncbi:MAG: CaiB/BaiF CoA transferase family protein [Vicinamibacterales bacterium]